MTFLADWRLVQAFPHPIMTLRSRLSHPPARFRLDPITSTLHVLFDSDPFFREPGESDDWRTDDFIVEAVPRKRRAATHSTWSVASEQAGQVLSGLGSTAATLGEKLSAFGLFSGLGGRDSASGSRQTSPKIGSATSATAAAASPPLQSTSSGTAGPTLTTCPVETTSVSGPTPTVPASDSSLRRTIHVEHSDESDPDSDSDSEPSAYRALRVVRLEPGWRDKYPAEALRAAPDKSFGVTRWSSSPKDLRQWRRRTWDVIPVTIRRLPAPHFPVHNAGPSSGGGAASAPMSAASESRSTSAWQSDSQDDGSLRDRSSSTTEEEEDDDENPQRHLAPPGMYALADYFGIGSHETSGASSPVESRSRRPSTHATATTVTSSGPDSRRWPVSETLAPFPPRTAAAAAASHLTGLLSSRLLPLSLAPGQTGDAMDGDGTDGETTGLSESTPRLPRDEWDASEVDSRALDALARERQSSSSSSDSSRAGAGAGESDAETPRGETGPVRLPARPRRTSTERPPVAASSSFTDTGGVV